MRLPLKCRTWKSIAFLCCIPEKNYLTKRYNSTIVIATIVDKGFVF